MNRVNSLQQHKKLIGELVNEFKGKLGIYKIIKTEDQTETVWSEYFNEACHNLSGAKEETIYNYIHGCHLFELFTHEKSIHILDIGFGIGMGLTCLIEFINNHAFYQHTIYYTSLELDDVFAAWSLKKFHPEIILTKETHFGLQYLIGNYKNIHIKILLGDARITLPKAYSINLIPKLNAIFQDAFSPKKNPTLWTVEWFSFLKSVSVTSVRIATYSSAKSIRKSMISAGWIVEDHKGFGIKKSMTKGLILGTMDAKLLEQLARSPALPFHDLE